MPHRSKGKEGNGARAQSPTTESRGLQTRTAEPSRLTPRPTEHPLGRLRDEIDAMFDRFFGRWPSLTEGGFGPSGFGPERFWDVDVQERDQEVLVRAEAPGFEPKDFDISISGNALTIQAEHKQEAEEKQGEVRTWERHYGRFQRSIPLSAAVDPDKVEAQYRNGVLELRLPRTEEARRKRIEVKA